MRVSVVHMVALVAAVTLPLAGCSSSEPPAPKSTGTTTPAPKELDLPAGVTLTKGGTSGLKVGTPATVVYQVGDRAASAVTVTIADVTKGSMEDFRFFSLDEATKKSTPYYVKVAVKNEGPAGLGGSALPIYAFDSTSTNLPPNDIVGTFKPCPNPTLPESFLPGAVADLCLVYLIPEGRTLKAVTLQTGSSADAVTWGPGPATAEDAG